MKLLALCLVLLLVVPAIADGPNPKVVGKVDGQDVHEFTLSAGKITMKVLSYGGIVRELHVPDKAGKTADVVLGFDTVDEYVKGNPYFGCLTGRVCNRIARGKFTLDGKTYTLATNNDPNHLHGGVKGFDKRVWACKQTKPNSLQLSYSSADGEEGYPGKLDVTVTYMLTPEGEWHIDYEAKADKATPVNLTQHAYFNLAGHAAGTILDHNLEIRADNFTECDATLIPTGALKSVSGTAFDFRSPTPIRQRIKETGLEPLGYDLNYALARGPSLAPKCAHIRDPKSGRAMEVYTTEPGVQLYTANHQTGQTIGKGKVAYPQYCGFCLECQHFPDAINQPKFASVVLKPGETYRQKTIYRFLAE